GVAGQRGGVAVLAGLEEHLAEIARRAATSTLDDLGSATVQADIASLRHRQMTQPPR
ncbi:urease accessory protein UreF, partial [Rhizobium ruizarguesonis]